MTTTTLQISYGDIKPIFHQHRIVLPTRLIAEFFGIPADQLSKQVTEKTELLMGEPEGKYFYLTPGEADEVLWTTRGVALIAHYCGEKAWQISEELKDTYFDQYPQRVTRIKCSPPAAVLRHFARLTEMAAKAESPFVREQHINTMRSIASEYGIDLADPSLIDQKPDEDPLVKEFFDNLAAIEASGKPMNHHAEYSHYLAVNINEYLYRCNVIGIKTPSYSTLKRALHSSTRYPLLHIKSSWSRIEKRSVRCWVFSLAQQAA